MSESMCENGAPQAGAPTGSEAAPLDRDGLAQLCSWLQDTAERERAELARTLHDELGGLLTAAKMDVSWLQSRTATALPAERLAQLAAVLDEAMDLKRRLVEELRPSLLVHFGLATALRTHVTAVLERAGISSDLRLDEDCDPMPRELAIVLFRIVDAVLAGSARRCARHITLRLACDARVYELMLSEQAACTALDAGHAENRALLAARERVEALGGTLQLRGSGTVTRISARLPRP